MKKISFTDSHDLYIFSFTARLTRRNKYILIRHRSVQTGSKPGKRTRINTKGTICMSVNGLEALVETNYFIRVCSSSLAEYRSGLKYIHVKLRVKYPYINLQILLYDNIISAANKREYRKLNVIIID